MDRMDLNPRPACMLDTLPAEVVEEIALHLAYTSRTAWERDEPRSQAFGNLRATCKTLEAKTHHTFLPVFFKSRKVDFSSEGLHTLEVMASVPELAAAVTLLKFVRNSPSQGEIDDRNHALRASTTEEERQLIKEELDWINVNLHERAVSAFILNIRCEGLMLSSFSRVAEGAQRL
ncbi:hypothetical protein K458DRAFT_107250 [Lentithecium fluviatile CBS 122367]|uniref:Uncharacterized protein n=1 Tax=Lentithecium fluviatile CBS 122367 TaxID=1168545 RepID=A0A6G1IPI7_9PLEO|nr:hypothetical protein K458DRAFT_107250 [Lentithecium fluviatile CBS 122367]